MVDSERQIDCDKDYLLTMECATCMKTFTELENFKKHLECLEHKQKMCSMQERPNDLPNESESAGSTISNCEETIKCNVCDLSFKDFEDFQNHAVTPEHAIKVLQKQTSNVMTDHELNAVKLKEETTNNSTLHVSNKLADFSYGKCELCIKIFSGPEPYKQHLESQAHKRKVALQQNSTYAAGNVLKCEPCNKSFSGQAPYAQHMSSETHKKKLRNIEAMEDFIRKNSTDSQAEIKENAARKEYFTKTFFCDICKIDCSGLIPYQQHLNGSCHFKNLKRVQSLNNSMTQLQMNKVSEEQENPTQITDALAINKISEEPENTTEITDALVINKVAEPPENATQITDALQMNKVPEEAENTTQITDALQMNKVPEGAESATEIIDAEERKDDIEFLEQRLRNFSINIISCDEEIKF